MRKLFIFIGIFFFGILHSQELNCVVKVNTQSLPNANQTIFKTLENALNEFVNKTKWSNLNFKQREKIDCSIFINVTSYNSDQFVATIQVQSSRPIFNSTYSSPIFNFNDKDFNFKYTEYEALRYSPNSFDSNLVSVLAFYTNIIIGIDGDSFSPQGGTIALESAREVVNVAQQSGLKGWNQSDGNQNRYFLINDLLSNIYTPIREVFYDYHFKGLDLMSTDLKSSKEKIKNAIISLNRVSNVRPNAFITRVFFDAKSDEIQSLFSGGPTIDIIDLIDNLNKISPSNSNKWASIRY